MASSIKHTNAFTIAHAKVDKNGGFAEAPRNKQAAKPVSEQLKRPVLTSNRPRKLDVASDLARTRLKASVEDAYSQAYIFVAPEAMTVQQLTKEDQAKLNIATDLVRQARDKMEDDPAGAVQSLLNAYDIFAQQWAHHKPSEVNTSSDAFSALAAAHCEKMAKAIAAAASKLTDSMMPAASPAQANGAQAVTNAARPHPSTRIPPKQTVKREATKPILQRIKAQRDLSVPVEFARKRHLERFSRLRQHLKGEHLNQEGLFRISSNPKQIKATNARLAQRRDTDPQPLSGVDLHAIANQIKTMIRDYPGGLFGDRQSQAQFQDALIALCKAESNEKNAAAKKFSNMLGGLPQENQQFFHQCMDLIEKVEAGQHKSENKNKMGRTNLISVIAPNFFPDVPISPDKAMAIHRHQEGLDAAGGAMRTRLLREQWGLFDWMALHKPADIGSYTRIPEE